MPWRLAIVIIPRVLVRRIRAALSGCGGVIRAGPVRTTAVVPRKDKEKAGA